MPIIVACQCGKKFRVSREHAGRKAKCPNCGQVLTIPALEPDSLTAGNSAALSSAQDERPWCSKCGDRVPAADIMDIDGQFVCKSCLDQSAETSPAREGGSKSKVRWIGAAVALVIIAVAVFRYSTTGNSPKPGVESSPVASSPKSDDSSATPEDQAPTPAGDDATQAESGQATSPQTTPPVVAPPKPATKPPQGRRAPGSLLSAFLPIIDDSLPSYRDHEITLAEQGLLERILSDEELVGDGRLTEMPYPVPDLASLGWGSQDSHDRTATLNLYVHGKGVTPEAVKSRFGAPRLEKQTPSTSCLVYGNVGVLFNKKSEFIGVVAVLFPEEKPTDVDPGETPQVAALTPKNEIGQQAPAPAPQNPNVTILEPKPGDPSKAPSLTAKDPGSSEPADWGPALELKYQIIRDPDDPMASIGRRYIAAVSRGSQNYQVLLGRRQVAIALEPGTPPAVRVDTNGNNDLSDEERVPGVPARGRTAREAAYRFGPIECEPRTAGAEPVQFFLQTYSTGYLLLYPARYRAGDVRLGNDSYHVAVADCDFDGRYDSVCQLPVPRSNWSRSDCIAIDRNKNKRFDLGGPDRAELQPLTRMIGARDDYYLVRVEPDGSGIYFQKGSPKSGTLDIGQPAAELLVLGDAGAFRLAGRAKWTLPEGKYSCWSVILRGRGCSLPSIGRMGQLGAFDIHAGQTTEIPVGTPLFVRTSASESKQSSGTGKLISVGLTVMDRAGVEYAAGAEVNGQKLPAPSLKILNPTGRVMHIGKFAYG